MKKKLEILEAKKAEANWVEAKNASNRNMLKES